MAFVTAEQELLQKAGAMPGTVVIRGSYTNSAGGTGGVIAPGYTNSSGSFTAVSTGLSTGCLKIVSWDITPATQDVTTPAAVKSYNSTLDRDIITITTVADATGEYVLECYNAGYSG